MTGPVAGFEVLTTVIMKKSIFWDTVSCSPSKMTQNLGGTCLPSEGQRTSQARNCHEAVNKQSQKIRNLQRDCSSSSWHNYFHP
jgi:hypothetical protein